MVSRPRLTDCLWWQVLLTDVETLQNGPTQFVPMSHLSGREPNDQQEPSFQGKGPISMIGKAGDAYIM